MAAGEGLAGDFTADVAGGTNKRDFHGKGPLRKEGQRMPLESNEKPRITA
jgi:hypothetical protein